MPAGIKLTRPRLAFAMLLDHHCLNFAGWRAEGRHHPGPKIHLRVEILAGNLQSLLPYFEFDGIMAEVGDLADDDERKIL